MTQPRSPRILMRFLLPLILLLLAGCQSAPRPYDGVKGYELVSLEPDTLTVTYTDEAIKSWATVTREAQRVCLDKLGIEEDALAYTVLEKEEFSKDVMVSIPVPIEVATVGGGGESFGNAPPMQGATTYQQQGMSRHLKFRKMKMVCRLNS